MKDGENPLKGILEAIGRGRGSWALTAASGKAMLAVGAAKAVTAAGGFIVTLGLGREELVKLRDAADEALALLDRPS